MSAAQGANFDIPEPRRYRDSVFGIIDSGVPDGSTDYTTIVLIHGAGSNGGQFSRFLPVAASQNARVVLLNRRDYKASMPIPSEEVKHLAAAATLPDDAARARILEYKHARSREFFDFLCAFALHENIPVPWQDGDVTRGGIVVTGWSAGNMLVTGLLANISGFKSAEIDLRAYITRVVLYDGPHRILGYVAAEGSDGYNPHFDAGTPVADRGRLFSIFVSGYYDHGNVPGVYEDRHPAADPPPTTLTTPDEERLSSADPAPMRPGGSDMTLISLGKKYGTFESLKNSMLYLDEKVTNADIGTCWDNLEIQLVWGERSVWEIPKAAWEMQKEVDEGNRAGKRMRKVVFTMTKGGNHFFHRERPVEALKLFLTGVA